MPRSRFHTFRDGRRLGQDKWPAEAELRLRHALKAEPNDDTRESMRKVLQGEPLQF